MEVSIITYFSYFIKYRFGTSVRKETKRLDVPGPGTHDIKSYTDAGTKVLL